MYYLQSRYYDAKICRFINADSALYGTMLGYNLFAYCENNPITRTDPTGRFWFCEDIDLDEDDMMERGGGGYGYYYGPGSAYHNFSVRTNTAASDAALGKYYSPGPSSAMLNPSQYIVPGAVTVTDSMATSGGNQANEKNASVTNVHGNSLQSTKTNYGYALVDSKGNILKFGETINPTTRYTKSYLEKHDATMKILDSGSKIDIHLWQHDMNEYYYYKYNIYPPLNKGGW